MNSFYSGYKRVWHSGGVSTYKSQLWLIPEVDMALYVAVNGPPTSGTTWALTLLLMYATDLFLHDTPWLNHTTACSFPAPWGQETGDGDPKTPPDPLPNDPLPEPTKYYIGSYSAAGFTGFNVTFNADSEQLLFQMGEMMEGILQYDSKSQLFYLNLTGDLWFMPLHIPVSFKIPAGGGGANAHMPVVPSAAAEPIVFYREGQEPHVEDKPRSARCSSNSSSASRLAICWQCSCMAVVLSICLLNLFKET